MIANAGSWLSLAGVMAATLVIGLLEVLFRHSETTRLVVAHDDTSPQSREAIPGGRRCESIHLRTDTAASVPAIAHCPVDAFDSS